MMKYTLEFSPQAISDIDSYNRGGEKALLKKFWRLAGELTEHPRTGTGQVERLKHYQYPDTWSRRLSDKHRIIYEIHDDVVKIRLIAAKEHYADK